MLSSHLIKPTGIRKFLYYLNRDKLYIFLLLPALAYYIVFHYLPMVGIVWSFQDFRIGRGFFNSEWVGFKWFIQFAKSHYFTRLIRNTVLLNLYSLLFGFPVPIFFAITLNEIKRRGFKRFTQTVSYLPNFISVVIVVGILTNFLSLRTGILNQFISNLGGQQINFWTNPKWFRTIFVSSGIWHSFGFSSIVYIAAISSVDQDLYEALEVDGGNKLRAIWHITLPGIKSTIMILLILNLGSMFSSSVEKVILIYSESTYETADVIGTFVYRSALTNSAYSYATAVGLFVSVINFILLAVVNKISKHVSEVSLW